MQHKIKYNLSLTDIGKLGNEGEIEIIKAPPKGHAILLHDDGLHYEFVKIIKSNKVHNYLMLIALAVTIWTGMFYVLSKVLF